MGAGLKTVEELRLTDEQRDLVAENIWLAYSAARQLIALHPEADPHVIRSSCYGSLMRAARTWEPVKGRLSTYFWRWARKRAYDAACLASLETLGPVEARLYRERFDGDDPAKRLARRNSITHLNEPGDAGAVSPLDAVIARDQHERDKAMVKRFLRKLSPKQREAVRMCVMQGMSSEEAAKLLGKTHQSVYSTMQLGLQKLREYASQKGIAWRA